MRKTHAKFKFFLPLVTVLGVLTIPFGALTFIFDYKTEEGITFSTLTPFLLIAACLLAIGFCVAFIVKVDHLHVKNVKGYSGFAKFASALASIMVLVVFAWDAYKIIFEPNTSTSTIFKGLRLIVAIPFIFHILSGIIPSRIKRRRINIPRWVYIISGVCSILWCLFGTLSIYFFNSNNTLPKFFIIAHTIFYILATLFFLFEVKHKLIKQNARVLLASALLLFVYTLAIHGSAIFASMITEMNIPISMMELLCALFLSLYALSRLYAVKATLKRTIDNEEVASYSKKFNKKATKDFKSDTPADKTAESEADKATDDKEKSPEADATKKPE